MKRIRSHSADQQRQLDMFVIDVLRHDIEDVEAVLRMLNNTGVLGWRKFWPHDFSRDEVLTSLDRLVRSGLVRLLEYEPASRELVDVRRAVDVCEQADLLWFKLEQAALDLWNKWQSPKELEE